MSGVLEPGTVQEVADILRDAGSRGARVTVVGSGTDTLRHETTDTGVSLSVRRLSGMEIYEPADLTFTAGAGTTLAQLEDALGPNGQFLPFDPPRAPERTLGGVVATGLGGPLGAGYGLVRDQVLGITLVTGDGRILRLGGRVMKNVAGFDLVRLVVGSRGRLGVVVSASLRVFPRPAVDRVLVVEDDLSRLLDAAKAVRTAPRVPASALLTRAEAGGPCALQVRIQGSGSVVDADEAVFGAGLPQHTEAHDGGEARSHADTARDVTLDCGVRLRLTALPGSLDGLLGAVDDTVGEAAFQADVMTGAVSVGMPEPTEATLRSLVGRVRELGGSALLLTGPAEWLPAMAEGGPAAALADRVRRRFDPEGTLAPGGTPA